MSTGPPERGVWMPRRTPSAPEVRAWTPPDIRAALGAVVEDPTDAVRHIAAAARGQRRAVVQAPAVQGAEEGLLLGAALAGAAGRRAELITRRPPLSALAAELGVASTAVPSEDADAWFVDDPLGEAEVAALAGDRPERLIVVATEAWSGGPALADALGADVPCAWIDAVPWHRLRTRILAPLRRTVRADAAQMEAALASERARTEAAGEPFEPSATVGVESWARALGRCAAERPAGVLWAEDARGCLRGLLVARCVREGRMLAPGEQSEALAAMASDELRAVRDDLARSEERAVYGVLSRLRADRSAATSIVAWVGEGGAWLDESGGTSS